ncbi:hypothetical protein Tco_1516561 [Tanacetum coccineum]
MPVVHSFEENKLEYKDEDAVEIKMMGTRIDKESLEHNLYENDITPIICHNFSLTSNPPREVLRGIELTRRKLGRCFVREVSFVVIFDEKKLENS